MCMCMCIHVYKVGAKAQRNEGCTVECDTGRGEAKRRTNRGAGGTQMNAHDAQVCGKESWGGPC